MRGITQEHATAIANNSNYSPLLDKYARFWPRPDLWARVKGFTIARFIIITYPREIRQAGRPILLITPGESLRWFLTSTIGSAHMAGVALVSAGGTAVNRPGEYGPRWRGFGDRFEIGMIGSAAENAIEIGVSLGLREDPRYFRVPQRAFKTRVGNVGRLTFLARNQSGRSEPAYARYIGIVGGNFLSNAWRAPSEANVKYALLRSAEGFAGRMAANAFKEFWPDVKRYVSRRRNRLARLNIEIQTEPR
jgi:hypothetical protein